MLEFCASVDEKRENKDIMQNALAIAVIILFGILSFFTLRPLELIRDSAAWSRLIESGATADLFNPHHLIYMVVTRGFYTISKNGCINCTAVDAGIIHNFIWFIGFSVALFYLFRCLLEKKFIALLLSLFVFISHSVWMFSLQPQAYFPAFSCLIIVTALLFFRARFTNRYFLNLATALFFSFGILYQQAIVLAGFPIAIFLASRNDDGWKDALSVVGISGSLVLSTYLGIFFIFKSGHSLHDFLKYVTLYGAMSDPHHWSFSNFTSNVFIEQLIRQMESVFLVPWRVRELSAAAYAVLSLSAVGWNLYQIFKQAAGYHERIFLITMFLLFWGFALWGGAAGYGWPMMSALFLFLLIGACLRDFFARHGTPKLRLLVTSFLLLLVPAVGAKNFMDKIYPMHIDPGPAYKTANLIAAVVPEQCEIHEVSQPIYQSLFYYHNRHIRDLWDLITDVHNANDFGKTTLGWSDFNLDKVACASIAASVLAPSGKVEDLTGFDEPTKWFSFFRWYTGLESDRKQEGIKHRRIESVKDARGDTYMILWSDWQQSKSLASLFRSLDEKIDSTGSKHTFMSWLEANPEIPKQLGLAVGHD